VAGVKSRVKQVAVGGDPEALIALCEGFEPPGSLRRAIAFAGKKGFDGFHVSSARIRSRRARRLTPSAAASSGGMS
jgi:hypothetical protein